MDYRTYAKNKGIDLTETTIAFELSHLITQARLHAGLTQKELAESMGTTQSSIARAESGDQEPSVSFLDRVAKAAGMTLVLPKLLDN